MAEFFDTLAETCPLPAVIVCDNGPEFTILTFDQWAYRHGISLSFIQPGKPQQNALIESFNGKLREECLSGELLFDLRDAQIKVEA